MLTFQTYQTELSAPKAEKIFTLCNGLYKIVKLDDKTLSKLNGGIQAIDVSCSFFFPFSRFSLSLAEFYVVLKRLFGESSLSIDSYKQGFSFVFLVAVKNRFLYLFDLCDFRGHIEFRLDKILESGRGDMTYRPFIEDEFSKEEYEQFVDLFVGFLEDFSKTYIEKIGTEIHIPPFAHFIESNLYVYEYMDGDFFERSFESQGELGCPKTASTAQISCPGSGPRWQAPPLPPHSIFRYIDRIFGIVPVLFWRPEVTACLAGFPGA